MSKEYNTYVVIGLQFGDEGKGKIIDILANDCDLVVRYQGGNNAGHSVSLNSERKTLNMLPCGILSTKGKCILSSGTLIDIETFLDEVYDIEKDGRMLTNLFIDSRAHIIMPYHKLIDKAKAKILGKTVIKISKNGITPCYIDKISKIGIRISDLLNLENFSNKLTLNLKEKNDILEKYGEQPLEFDEIYEKYKEYTDKLRYRIIDGMLEINKYVDQGKKVLFEGTQATMLDADFGTYPDVNTAIATVGGVCTGTGLSPNKIKNIIGVFKSYCTRVLDGAFPTIMESEIQRKIIQKGNEISSINNSVRKCGWLDLVILKYSCLINGVTEMHMTKLDVLTGIEKIKVAIAYELDGKIYQYYPANYEKNTEINILYKDFDGWTEDISKIRTFEDLPENCQRYVEYIEGYLDIKISLISVGPNKDQTIFR